MKAQSFVDTGDGSTPACALKGLARPSVARRCLCLTKTQENDACLQTAMRGQARGDCGWTHGDGQMPLADLMRGFAKGWQSAQGTPEK